MIAELLQAAQTAAAIILYLLLALLLWELCVGHVRRALLIAEAHLTPRRLPHFSLASLVAPTAVPHRAYALSCALLE